MVRVADIGPGEELKGTMVGMEAENAVEPEEKRSERHTEIGEE